MFNLRLKLDFEIAESIFQNLDYNIDSLFGLIMINLYKSKSLFSNNIIYLINFIKNYFKKLFLNDNDENDENFIVLDQRIDFILAILYLSIGYFIFTCLI